MIDASGASACVAATQGRQTLAKLLEHIPLHHRLHNHPARCHQQHHRHQYFGPWNALPHCLHRIHRLPGCCVLCVGGDHLEEMAHDSYNQAIGNDEWSLIFEVGKHKLCKINLRLCTISRNMSYLMYSSDMQCCNQYSRLSGILMLLIPLVDFATVDTKCAELVNVMNMYMSLLNGLQDAHEECQTVVSVHLEHKHKLTLLGCQQRASLCYNVGNQYQFQHILCHLHHVCYFSTCNINLNLVLMMAVFAFDSTSLPKIVETNLSLECRFLFS